MRQLLLVAFLVGCGPSGETMEGDVTVQYGDSSPDMVVGAAVRNEDDPTKMLIQLGSDEVDCDTYLDVFLSFGGPEGTFVYFNTTDQPGEYANTYVSVQKAESNSSSTNTSSGMVTITAVEPRVTGSVTFSTTDEDVGAITVDGTFDVKRCF